MTSYTTVNLAIVRYQAFIHICGRLHWSITTEFKLMTRIIAGGYCPAAPASGRRFTEEQHRSPVDHYLLEMQFKSTSWFEFKLTLFIRKRSSEGSNGSPDSDSPCLSHDHHPTSLSDAGTPWSWQTLQTMLSMR